MCVASWLSVVGHCFRCALLRGLLLWVTVLGVRCFVAVCFDHTLQVCGSSWLSVVIPPFRCAVLRGLRPHIASSYPGRGWGSTIPTSGAVGHLCGVISQDFF